MEAYQIHLFREKLAKDKRNLDARREFHEQYEWLESYWQRRYRNNHVARFSSEFNSFYWELPELKELARKFSSYPPVGNSKRDFEPSESVKKATFFLKHHMGLFDIELPDIENEKALGRKWSKNPLEAILVIVKQVRDNLFHGRKMELESDQYERNYELVSMSRDITRLFLDSLAEAEDSV